MSAKNAINRLFAHNEIAKQVNIPYIKARVAINRHLPLRVKDTKEFHNLITFIVRFFESKAGVSTSNEILALQKAEMILNRYGDGGILLAKDSAIHGIAGGITQITDFIYEAMKGQSEESYFLKVIREEVDELNDQAKLKFIEAFFEYKGPLVSSTLRKTRPEELINKYMDIIRKEVHIANTLHNVLGL